VRRFSFGSDLIVATGLIFYVTADRSNESIKVKEFVVKHHLDVQAQFLVITSLTASVKISNVPQIQRH
jgi:hypothetical protein